MPLTIRSTTISDDVPAENRKADRAVQSLTGTSRRETVGLFDHHCVWLNGTPCSAPWQRLAVGDTIEVRYYPAQRYLPQGKRARSAGLDILFEDAHLIVVNKPPHCLTVPAPGHDKNTLVQRLAAYLGRKPRRGPAVFTVQRLDREASGVLVFAKSPEAWHQLRAQFAAHTPEREYAVIVAGRLDQQRGTIRSRLTTNRRLKRYSTSSTEPGELAVTRYEVQQQLADATYVRVRLETGRRNQIRVHFAEGGHPVLGDTRYEPLLAVHPRWPAKRLALHAVALAFQHPMTGRRLQFEAPLPREFRRFLG
jgi:23S rRNA pseudouridine1911/1915/1917 synthase